MKAPKALWITMVLLLIVTIATSIYIQYKNTPWTEIPEKSVLFLNATGSLPEVSLISPSFLDVGRSFTSFLKLLRHLHEAKNDEKIKLVVIDIGLDAVSPAKCFELKDAILDYKKSGKPIWGYLRHASDFDYLIASACDTIIQEPYGYLELNGISKRLFFFEKTFKSINIDIEAVSVGKYKSAVESFTRTTPSKESLQQENVMLDVFFKDYIKNIVENRGIRKEVYLELINEVGIISDKEAKLRNIVDTVLYFDDMKKWIKEKLNIDSEDKKSFITSRKYSDIYEKETDSKIAVIAIMGDILNSESKTDVAGSASIIRSLEDARKNEKVKAIILRIDSPGGEVSASNNIRKAIMNAQKEKPVIVSMSGLAASGGYWISASANKIYAHPLTVTGSIGIFFLKPSIKQLIGKVGIQHNTLKRGHLSDDFSIFKKFSESAYKSTQKMLLKTYKDFITLVAEGRNKEPESIETLAQGRVWLGKQAKNLGLVDHLGGFMDALKATKSMVSSNEDISIVIYPKPRTILESLLQNKEKSIYQNLVEKLAEDTKASMFKSYNPSLFNAELHQLKTALHLLSKATIRTQYARLPFTMLVE